METSTTRLTLLWILLSLSGQQVYSAGPSLKRVTTVLDAPYMKLAGASSAGEARSGNDRYEGFCADLVKELSLIVGFNYTIQPVKDGKYGVKNADGTWSGMVGELTRGEADLAVAPLVITAERERVVDFTRPFLSLGIAIMIKKPDPFQTVAELTLAFLSPFPVGVWIGLLVACPTIGLLLFLFARFNPAETQQPTTSPSSGAEASSGDVRAATSNNGFNLSNSLWFSLKTMLQQGTNTDPRSVSCRILSAVWWMFAVVVVAAYTTNLVVIATQSRAEDWSHIKSAKDLAEQSDIRYGTINMGSTSGFFKTAAREIYEKMWIAMSSSPSDFVDTTEEGVNRVRTSGGRYAFLAESTVIDYYNELAPCDTIKVGKNLDSKGYGIATAKDSDLSDRISLAVLELAEEDELAALQRKWWFQRSECSGIAIEGERSHLVNIRGVFYALIIGVLAAALTAVLESVYWRKKQPSTQPGPAKGTASSSADGSNKA